MIRTRVVISDNFPAFSGLGSEFLIVADAKLRRHAELLSWMAKLRRSSVVVVYWVAAGEKLKDISSYPSHVLKIQKLLGSDFGRSMRVVCVGGGSVGDFAGFFASTYKRGVGFIQMPSTLLAALDSAHGGKNGLNVGGAKNQVGTIYQPSHVFVVKKLFIGLDPERWIEAYGELYKIAWLSGGSLWVQINRMKNLDLKSFWPLLSPAIRGKYKIVQKDPLESSGHRHLLNLGHTLGHVFESYFQLPHGLAVLAGMDFAFFFSAQKSYLKVPRAEIFAQPSSLILSTALAKSRFRRVNFPALLTIPPRDLVRLLAQDKKRVKGSNIRFIFPVKPGKCRIENVSMKELLQEFARQRHFFMKI